MAGKEDKAKEEFNEEQEHTDAVPTSEPEDVVEDIADSSELDENDPERKFNELNNKYVRLYSDFDNFRRRTIKEKADIISTATEDVMKEVLVILDDFERAIANNESADDIDKIKEGFELIHNKLFHVLANKGLERMDAKGEVFDPEMHEAITNIPAQSDADKGKVMDVIEKGYNLNGKPIRYAKVVVGQ